MIRRETSDGWLLITHGEHARLAWRFASAWGNDTFTPPMPRHDVLEAVLTHDDGWQARDAQPFLGRDGAPEAFTQKLVGAYAAFEDIDLPAYLRVRADATAAVAARNPFAAIVVSMHTVNLLTEQADLSSLAPGQRGLHAEFVAAQRAFQLETAAMLNASMTTLERAFRFLQTCDHLSLIACAGSAEPRPLRHRHENTAGEPVVFHCTPLGSSVFQLSPSPFREKRIDFPLEARRLGSRSFSSVDAYRAALDAAPRESLTVTIVSG